VLTDQQRTHCVLLDSKNTLATAPRWTQGFGAPAGCSVAADEWPSGGGQLTQHLFHQVFQRVI